MANIKHIFLFFVIMLVACQSDNMSVPSRLVTNSYGGTQLMVNNQPFLMIGGEIHNSSNSTTLYMNSLWESLQSLNINTVLAAVSWEQFEPVEGEYDYTLLDNLIVGARAHNIKVVILWFGSWKNGESSYAPVWVKRDTERFPRVLTKDGRKIETLSPFSANNMYADARAFAAMMRHIRHVDSRQGTVIAVQPENEVGIFADMDYNAIALEGYQARVPQALIDYMLAHQDFLRPELDSVWKAAGQRTEGTWSEVFGDNIWSRSFYITWQYASYINTVASAGKAEYPLPMFCNSWIVQAEEDLPGVYPNGGPVSRVFDIWKAAAPAIDILCPDIYLETFKEITADYHRADNPLCIPESRLIPAQAFWAFGEHHALCYAPFGIEDGAGNEQYADANKVLQELTPLITRYQGSRDMIGIMHTPDEQERIVTMGDYRLRITYMDDNAYGIIIHNAPYSFVVAGINMRVEFSSNVQEQNCHILQVWEGEYTDGRWQPTRLLNGDETFHNAMLRVRGRCRPTAEKNKKSGAENDSGIFVYAPNTYQLVWSPAIYHVAVYTR